MSITRMYIVTTLSGESLVEATNPSQAIRAVTHAGVTCEPATSKDVVRLMGAGAKVIDGAAKAEASGGATK